MEERKITLVDDDQTLEFYVVEETKLNGANYLLVTDAEDDDLSLIHICRVCPSLSDRRADFPTGKWNLRCSPG